MDVMEELRGFRHGIQAAAEHDETPLESSPYAWNTSMRSIGGGQATLGTRPGLKIVNTTALTSTPAFLMIKNYPYYSAGTVTNKLALVTAVGKLYFKDDTNTIGGEITPPANFPYASGQCFTSGDHHVDAAVMNNRLFLLNTNGERRSILNETFKMFGLDHLATIAVSNQAGGSATMPAETYDVAVTTYDSATGAESSTSPVQTVTLAAGERIRVIVTPSAGESARYSHWRVYLRRQTTQANMFRVLVLEDSGGSNIVTTGDIPIGTTTVYVDLSSTDIANHVLVAPSETENNEPPTTVRYIATYGERLILADLQNIYWSKIGLPDAFPALNVKRINTGEGDEIRGLYEFSDDLLLIFTANNVWGVFGNDPLTWEVKPIDHSVGCSNHRSICQVPGAVLWWSSTNGPVLFDGSSVLKVGLDKLGQSIVVEDIEGSRLSHVMSGFDPIGQRAIWSYTLLNGTRNTAMVPFNTRVQEFEATRWNPMDISFMGTGYDTDDKLRLFVGNYGGQLFVLDADTLNDGAPSGTVTGIFTPAASSIATIVTSDLYTTGAGLAERYVVVKDSMGIIKGRERISSNNATTITLAANITGLSAGTVHTFDIAGPDVRLYTKWMDFKQAFLRKRVDNVYIHLRTENDSDDLYMGTLVNYVNSISEVTQVTSNSGVAWDSEDAIWDSSSWGGSAEPKKRIRIIRNCNALQVALFHSTPNKDIIILKIAALARSLSDRYYG